ncbi:MAG: NUDIX hydrolase [Myxococcales bacterium]|nr:NUDIX hydrolase [Myxococcales bacterium]
MSERPPLHRPPRLRSRSIARYPLLELVEHDIADATGVERTVLTVELWDWCVAVARDVDGRWVLVEQHRHGVDAVTLEPAGGIIDRGEDPGAAAMRELEEETGYRGERAVPLGFVHPNPALSSNRSFAFLVDRVVKVREPDQAPDEETHVVLLDDAALDEALEGGRITHALAVVALMRAKQRLARGR